MVFAFEDLHWMDKSSEEAAKHLLESIPGARVAMIFTYRPEFVPTWSSKSYHSQVTINRLSNRESLTMMSHMLGSEDISPDLQELILGKTEGVPFFIEEFLRALKDMELIERTNNSYHLTQDMDRLAIPSTIQDVIMARVDSLTDAPKEVLQAGSAIEREFGYELIKAVTNLPEQEILSHLAALKDAELIYERGIFPQSTYIFTQALTREVVYDSILGTRKRLLHEKIGNTLEDVCGGILSDHYGALVEHFVAGDRHDKGAKYARLASKKAEKTASLDDAILYAEKGIEVDPSVKTKNSLF
jgi:predicted ATPase